MVEPEGIEPSARSFADQDPDHCGPTPLIKNNPSRSSRFAGVFLFRLNPPEFVSRPAIFFIVASRVWQLPALPLLGVLLSVNQCMVD